MVRLPTSVWTDRHAAVAVLLVVSLAGTCVGQLEDSRSAVLVTSAMAVVVTLGLAVDRWAGALVGLAGAVAVVALRRGWGEWGPESFGPALLETLALITAGTLSGRVGERLRGSASTAAPSAFEPAYGSLGLLGQDAAVARLEEEVGRAARGDRAVLLLLLDADVHPSAAEDRPSALRTVARVVESAAESQDIPFAMAADRFGIVFPAASRAAVWDVVDRILATVASATYPHGVHREVRPLQSVVELRISIAQQSPQAMTAQGILDEAVSALERGRPEEAAP